MAVWTAPTTRSTGALVSASIWNTDIVENLKYLKDSPVFDGDISVGDDLLFTSSGAVINFNSDATITHSTNTLTFAGASSGYVFNDGVITASAFGAHTFSAGATGFNRIDLRNTTAGTGNGAMLRLGNDTAAQILELAVTASTYTPGGPFLASAAVLNSAGSGGLSLSAENAAGAIRFYTGGATVRWTINSSGNLLKGTAAVNNDFVALENDNIQIGSSSTASSKRMVFYNSAEVGSISTSGAATSYNISSDARLKSDRGIAATTDVLARTRVHDFEWKSDGTPSRGVFAQEAYEVAPFAVTPGTDEIKDGQLAHPWSVDYSKYVPDLIVGWQQHDATLAQLTARIAALEAALESK